MILISGKTWEHKERLKDMGAKWNATNRQWNTYHLSDKDRSEISTWVGVTIGEPPSSLDDDDYTAITRVLEHDGKSKCFGDDQSWFNYFAGQNPTSFFGFSSLSAMTKYIKTLPEEISKSNSDNRNRAWAKTEPKWFGTPNMEAALDLARDGWPEGVELAEQISEQLTGRNAIERRRKYSVGGGMVNVGRMLAGNPLHMVSRPKQPGKKIITFFVEASQSATIKSRYMIIRAAITAAIVDILEANGFSCEIVMIGSSEHGYLPACQIATTLKAAGELLSINDLVFALGHPSYLRRLSFAVKASDERLRYIWAGMGIPSDAFDETHPTKPNEFYIKKIDHDLRSLINDDMSMMEQATQIWDLITEKDLPITINSGE